MFDLDRLAQRLQWLRADQQLSLAELSQRSGVSVSMLSAVERAERAPTVVVLAKIAEGLGESLVGLLSEDDDRRVVVRRARDQDRSTRPGGWERVVLSPVVPGVNFELVRVMLPAGCDAGDFPAYAHGSHEYLAVESGTLRLRVGDTVVDLQAGESVYFEADQERSFANVGDRPCEYYLAALIMRSRG
jgi:transcriptional regulator with XRE-family HTH domain